ncbi:LuxR C-terminal-related transcriptional regulator [Rhizohabitans arisaemae]|uniref:LuxR C-terminal-related transcriptional regulator n=1 Tax=Rhizohabitans arisaemae TaxID=2720610 RepID=UPI0024B252DF|nr:LuxR C-terminal-related transcriptional regulator [Rhizohabitans arisaemae]
MARAEVVPPPPGSGALNTVAVHSGVSLIPPAADAPAPASADDRLSAEDLLLLGELARGVTVETVGRRLEVSSRTVRRRLRGICNRLGVATAIEAVVWAARRSLI